MQKSISVSLYLPIFAATSFVHPVLKPTCHLTSSLQVRAKSMEFTDQRSKILQELLGAMRVIKYFVFEGPYADKIDELRRKELIGIR